MTKHKPATPLPWARDVTHAPPIITGPRKTWIASIHGDFSEQDADYIVHACNNYQKQERDRARLVEALRAYQDAARGGDWAAAIEGGNALLRELGEL